MLEDVIAALCHMLNIPNYCQPSWEVSVHMAFSIVQFQECVTDSIAIGGCPVGNSNVSLAEFNQQWIKPATS